MNIKEFCGSLEFTTLQFIFSLTERIREKIARKELIYKEQIVRYAKKQINYFFKSIKLKPSHLHVYKSEVYHTVMFKIKSISKEHNILRCI